MAFPGRLLFQTDMVWKAVGFDIWPGFSLVGKSSRPGLSGELGPLQCPEQSSEVSAVGTGTAARLTEEPAQGFAGMPLG